MRTSARLTLVAAAFIASVALPALVFPPPARADLGDVIRSIPCAGPNTGDLAWAGGILYQVNFAPTELKLIYKIDPVTGAVLGSIPPAGTSPQGLAFDGEFLWQSDVGGRMIYKLDPTTGQILAQFAAPGDTPQPLGLGWDGASLWLADSRSPEKIWELDRSGAVLGNFPAPGASPYGLDWAVGFIWVSDNAVGGLGTVYKMHPDTGAILASFPCPGGGGSPNGIAHDGEHLWIAVNTDDRIYQVDDGIGAAAVEDGHPAESTWGGIKALF
jgi:DNA-binding beta-propeller fold protein YncE